MSALAVPEDNTDIFEIPLVEASAESLKGYGLLVDDYEGTAIEIVPWPAQGRRPIDPGTGDQGGTTEGRFHFRWAGELLYGHNEAVNDSYLLGWSRRPEEASETAERPERSRVLIRHANYHPDGGQLFFPEARTPFVAPLALPGDEVTPGDFVAFYCDGSRGLYLHPGVWHEAILPLSESAAFADKQGRVHARVSCDFVREFGTYLSVPLRKPQ